jgi:hypothetical protein
MRYGVKANCQPAGAAKGCQQIRVSPSEPPWRNLHNPRAFGEYGLVLLDSRAGGGVPYLYGVYFVSPALEGTSDSIPRYTQRVITWQRTVILGHSRNHFRGTRWPTSRNNGCTLGSRRRKCGSGVDRRNHQSAIRGGWQRRRIHRGRWCRGVGGGVDRVRLAALGVLRRGRRAHQHDATLRACPAGGAGGGVRAARRLGAVDHRRRHPTERRLRSLGLGGRHHGGGL